MSKNRTLPSFQKGLRILECIATQNAGMRLADLAKAKDMPASNVSLYLNTLLEEDFVVRDPLNKHFHVHPRLNEMLGKGQNSLLHHLIASSEDALQNLFEQYNENVLLSVPKEENISVLKHINTTHVMRIGIEPERDFPMHIVAMGRAVLAHLPEKTIDRYLQKASLVKLTDKTIISEDKLRHELKKVKDNGYAFNPGEYESQVMAVAAPILIKGQPVASLSVQFPELRHQKKQAKEAAAKVMEQARGIEYKLSELIHSL